MNLKIHDWNTPDRKQKPDKLSKMYIAIKINVTY